MTQANTEADITKKLRLNIEKRKNQIEKIISFTARVTAELGEVRDRKRDNPNHITRELKDFRGFDFYYSSGESCLGNLFSGGETIRVMYNRNGPSILRDMKEVFSAHFQFYTANLDGCRVYNFDKNEEWQVCLKYIMKNYKRLAKQKEKEKLKKLQQELLDIEKRQKMEKFLENAKRLGL